MIRRIIQINEEKCNGCGLCATACHEGAIGIVAGKAKLLRDDYCDGLGDCLPVCPTEAISFVEREAEAYNEAAVLEHQKKMEQKSNKLACGCPGSQSKKIEHKMKKGNVYEEREVNMSSELQQWPVQIKLVPVNAPYFDGSHLLIATDCTAYAYADFHKKFIRNHITLVGCPKLDDIDYSEKLAEILKQNDIKSISIVRMEVPCCGGIVIAVNKALKQSKKMIPCKFTIISTDGEIIEQI